jgi:CHASE2 domain-containing sensor protein
MNLGIGIIGEDGNPANLVYASVLLIGAIGAIASRRKPAGLALTLFTMALAQAVIAIISILINAGMPWSPPLELLGLNGIFITIFIFAGLLFRRTGKSLASQERLNK